MKYMNYLYICKFKAFNQFFIDKYFSLYISGQNQHHKIFLLFKKYITLSLLILFLINLKSNLYIICNRNGKNFLEFFAL